MYQSQKYSLLEKYILMELVGELLTMRWSYDREGEKMIETKKIHNHRRSSFWVSDISQEKAFSIILFFLLLIENTLKFSPFKILYFI